MNGSFPSLRHAVLRRGACSDAPLGLPQVAVRSLGLAGAVAPARLLIPAEFGVHGFTVFVLPLLDVSGDAGAAAGLVREAAVLRGRID